MKRVFLLLLALTAYSTNAADGFLFVMFRGEQTPMSEQVHFALSRDGRSWKALNGGEPVLVSTIGEKGVRDPFILRSHDNSRVYLIGTDLSINLNRDWRRAVREGSRAILVWESTNLVNWSEPRRVEVAPADAGCTWAPEAIYDDEAGDYMVFWASTTRRDDFARHRIWAARTRDFKTFSEPFIYIEKPAAVIDTTIVRDGTNYVRFTKDETQKGITMEVSSRLMGTWRESTNFSLANLRGYEGPECYLVEPASEGKPPTWCLILDYYSRGQGYQPFITHDLSTGQFTRAEGFTFPFRFRHGSVLPLSEAECRKLEEAYGKE